MAGIEPVVFGAADLAAAVLLFTPTAGAAASTGMALPSQQTLAAALQVYSSNRPTSRNSSQVTSFLPTVNFLMPRSAVHLAAYLSSRSLASLVGPSLP